MVTAVEDPGAFLGHLQAVWLRGALRSNAQQIGTHGGRDARQRGMLRFVGVGSLVEPFHSAGDVIGLIGGMVEDRVGGDDADGSNQNQDQNGGPRMALQKRDYRRQWLGGSLGWWNRDWALALLDRHT